MCSRWCRIMHGDLAGEYHERCSGPLRESLVRRRSHKTLYLVAGVILLPLSVERLSEPLVAAQRNPSPAPEAQTTRPARQIDSPPRLETPDPEHLLAGPKVPDDDESGSGPESFAGRRVRRPPTVRGRQWFDLLEELELNRVQRGEVESIWSELRMASREFRRLHGANLNEVRQELRGIREAGGFPSLELREQFQRLTSLIPELPAYQRRAWDRLTSGQQEQFRRRLAAIRKAMARQQAEQSSGRRDMTDDRRRPDRAPPENDRPQRDARQPDG